MRGDRAMLYIFEGDPVGASRIWPRNSRWGTLIIVPKRSSPAGGGNGINLPATTDRTGDAAALKGIRAPRIRTFLVPPFFFSWPCVPLVFVTRRAALPCTGYSLRLVSGWVRLG